MIDRKLPRALRDHVPLIAIDSEIAAIIWGERWPVSALFSELPRSDAQEVFFSVEM